MSVENRLAPRQGTVGEASRQCLGGTSIAIKLSDYADTGTNGTLDLTDYLPSARQLAAAQRPAGACGALPGRTVDLIRDGVAVEDLQWQGSFAVDQALKATAKSAINVGMGEVEWWTLVEDPHSELGRQTTTVRDKRGHPRRATAREVLKRREAAWGRAMAEIAGSVPYTAGQVRAEAESRADAVLALLADADYRTPTGRNLLPSDRAVLAHLGDAARQRGLFRVAETRRAIMVGAGRHTVDRIPLGRKAVDKALVRLVAAGLIRKYRKGKPGADSGLSDIWEVLPPRQRAGSPPVPIEAGLRPAYGSPFPKTRPMAPPDDNHPRPNRDGTPMVPPSHLTAFLAGLSASDRAILHELLNASQNGGGAA